MTTTVRVQAHCSDDKEVFVAVVSGDSGETRILQDGETVDFHAYDGRVVTVKERVKVEHADEEHF